MARPARRLAARPRPLPCLRDDGDALTVKTILNVLWLILAKAIELTAFAGTDRNITATIPQEPTLAYAQVWSSANFFCWSLTFRPMHEGGCRRLRTTNAGKRCLYLSSTGAADEI